MMRRFTPFLFPLLFLVGCQLLTAQPDPELNAVYTQAVETARARLTEMAVSERATSQSGYRPGEVLSPSRTSHQSDMPTPTVAQVVVSPTVSPLASPLPFPTINPVEVPGLLEKSLSVQANSLNGHTLRKVTGWKYGFRDFYWMGSDHLFLNVITGFVPMRAGSILPQETRDLAISIVNLDSGKVWFPELTPDAWFSRMHYDDSLPRWSEKLQALLLPQTLGDGEVARVYSKDGDVLQSYPGHLLGVSPSGTRLLFADGTWLDLHTGKQVKFNWDQIAVDSQSYFARPVWSADENKVYVCCHAYGDASTGKSASMKGGEIYSMRNGRWIFNGRYVMAGHSPFPDIFSSPPLYDSLTNTGPGLGALAGFPANVSDEAGNPTMCNSWDSSPNGTYLWVECFDGGYLVNLDTFKTRPYLKTEDWSWSDSELHWSDDGNFAKVDLWGDSSKRVNVLSVASKELIPVPDDCLLQWPPVGNILLCESRDKPVISFLDARTMQVQKTLSLEIPCELNDDYKDGLAFCVSDNGQTWLLLDVKTKRLQKKLEFPLGMLQASKSPDGKRVVLLAEDGSLWQMAYPTLENLEQLTPAMPGEIKIPGYAWLNSVPRVRQLTWSPDSRYLAFLGDNDVYIVDAQTAP